MSATVAVIGEGRLADLVSDLLSLSCRIVRQLDLQDGASPQADLALVLCDGWHPRLLLEAETAFRQTGTPWLCGNIVFGEGEIGPLIRPERPGCTLCAARRRIFACRDRSETGAIRSRLEEQGRGTRDVWASHQGLQLMAGLLAEEAKRWLLGMPVRTDSRMYLVHLASLNVTRHFVLPDPLCEVCGGLPDDRADDARIALRPSPKAKPGSWRSRPLRELGSSLARDYLDARTGLLNGKLRDLLSPFADASVNLPLFGADEGAAGRTHRYTDSVLAAILEGLERRCGITPRGKRTAVRDSYRRLGGAALDPASVGLHAPEMYERPDFPFQRFDPDREMDWVWGYSFLRERPILVPEQLAYYSTGCGKGFVYETSNGCALGGSMEEAIFYGILEVLERDSFLLSWYARLPLPQLDPLSAGDAEMELMIERIRATAGFDILLFNSTMEHGVPCVWSLAKNRSGRGVNLICAAGAHPDPVRAAKSSIHELAGMVLAQNDRFEQHRQDWERMLEDPFEVRAMEHHSMLYALPEAESRFDFLLDPKRPLRSFEEAYGRPVKENVDLTEDLRELIDGFRKRNLDVIVVDQSTPETLRNRLYCVKVIMPGMLPMTFGYHLTRLSGLTRVQRVPAELGYAEKPLTLGELNPHPHPFP